MLPSTFRESPSRTPEDLLDQVMYFHPPTLSHLLALVSYPPPDFPPSATALVVVDSISSLFATEFPPTMPTGRHGRVQHGRPREKLTQWMTDRRWHVVGNLVT